MQLQEISQAAIAHARARVESGEVETETETAAAPEGAGNPCSCITSCCPPADAKAGDDDGYDYYGCCFRYFENLFCNTCSGCLDYLCNNIWQPIVGCFYDLCAGCGLYPTERAELRAVNAFNEKYQNGNKGADQHQFYRDFMKLPTRVKEYVRTQAETRGVKGQPAFEEFIKENEHTYNGVVMMSLRGFFNRHGDE
jgi:hypothetical protein